jgi:hypothetical protein
MIDDHEGNPAQIRFGPDFLEFPAPDESGWVEGISHLQDASRYECTGAPG